MGLPFSCDRKRLFCRRLSQTIAVCDTVCDCSAFSMFRENGERYLYYTPFKLAKKQWMPSTVRPLFRATVHPRPLFVHVSMKGTGNLRE